MPIKTLALSAGLGLLLLTALGPVTGCHPTEEPANERPESVVLMIGDGLGISQITFTRDLLRAPGTRLSLETLPVNTFVSTYSASNRVTDSASAATAMASGIKTDNRYVGWDPERQPVETIADRAQAADWQVGLVTSTRLTHATPAAFYAHAYRYAEDDIAAQLVDGSLQPQVLLGGGLSFFVPSAEGGLSLDDRDLLAEAAAKGYAVIRRGGEPPADKTQRLLGLFANDHLSYVLDDQALPSERRDPPLDKLARIALDRLDASGKPFFLMVEGGRIDHAGHAFDAASLALETDAFDLTVQAVLDYQKAHPETLVLITADHATGGLAINDFTDWSAFQHQTASVERMVSAIRNEGADAAQLAAMTGIETLSEADLDPIRAAIDKYEARRLLGRRLALTNGITWLSRTDDDTHGHTGEDVPLYAIGPGAENFDRPIDNTEIPKILTEILGWPSLAMETTKAVS